MTYIETGFAWGVRAGFAVLGFLAVLMAVLVVVGIFCNIASVAAEKREDDE